MILVQYFKLKKNDKFINNELQNLAENNDSLNFIFIVHN
jgi:hypothetical protein